MSSLYVDWQKQEEQRGHQYERQVNLKNLWEHAGQNKASALEPRQKATCSTLELDLENKLKGLQDGPDAKLKIKKTRMAVWSSELNNPATDSTDNKKWKYVNRPYTDLRVTIVRNIHTKAGRCVGKMNAPILSIHSTARQRDCPSPDKPQPEYRPKVSKPQNFAGSNSDVADP